MWNIKPSNINSSETEIYGSKQMLVQNPTLRILANAINFIGKIQTQNWNISESLFVGFNIKNRNALKKSTHSRPVKWIMNKMRISVVLNILESKIFCWTKNDFWKIWQKCYSALYNHFSRGHEHNRAFWVGEDVHWFVVCII